MHRTLDGFMCRQGMKASWPGRLSGSGGVPRPVAKVVQMVSQLRKLNKIDRLLASFEGAGQKVIAAQLFAVIKPALDDFRNWLNEPVRPADVGHRNRSTNQFFDPSLAAGRRLCGTRGYRSTKPSTAARETGRRLFLLRQLLILQCHPRPEQRPLDGRHAAVRLVEHSQSMGGLPRRSHVHQPGRIRIRIGGSPMVT